MVEGVCTPWMVCVVWSDLAWALPGSCCCPSSSLSVPCSWCPRMVVPGPSLLSVSGPFLGHSIPAVLVALCGRQGSGPELLSWASDRVLSRGRTSLLIVGMPAL